MIPWPQQPILNTPAEVTAWEQSHSGINYIDQHGQAVIRTLPPGVWLPSERVGMESYALQVGAGAGAAIFRAGWLYRHGKSDTAWIWQLNEVGRQVIADLATLLPSTQAPALKAPTQAIELPPNGMSPADLRILGDQIQELILNAAFCVEHGSTSWKKRS